MSDCMLLMDWPLTVKQQIVDFFLPMCKFLKEISMVGLSVLSMWVALT